MQDAFLGLYRRWDKLTDLTAPLTYLRVSVINGCRTALRRRSRLTSWPGAAADALDEAAPVTGLAESARHPRTAPPPR